jgi:tripeptidyl-peptidase-1
MTSVGATRLYPDQTVNDPESAMQVNLTAFNIQTGSGPTSPPYDFFASCKDHNHVYSSSISKTVG